MIARTLATVFAFAFAFVCACSDAPSTEDCRKLAAHMVNLELAAAGGGEVSPELEKDREAAKKATLEALEGDFVKSCEKQLPKSRVKCGLKATSIEAFAACDGDA